MSKKFKGKLCVYCCVATSTTGDHIFAKEFFLETRRKNLPMAPACSRCNAQKSKLEHYLTAVFPFGGRHTDAVVNLKTMAPKRLDRNAQLLSTLQATFRLPGHRSWEYANGLFVPIIGLPFDWNKFGKWLILIVKGLSWFHWKKHITSDCIVDVRWGYDSLFQRLLAMHAACHIRQDLGAGTFSYEAAQGIDNPRVSVWQFLIYGDARFGSKSTALSETVVKIGVLVSPKSMLDREEERLKWLVGRPDCRTA
jgi:hypothetical protein